MEDERTIRLHFKRGQTTVVRYNDALTVGEIREQAAKAFKAVKKDLKILFNGDLLQDDAQIFGQLQDVGPDCTIKIMGSYFGGILSLGCEFPDITQTDKAKKVDWSLTSPKWCLVEPGFSVEGTCKNKGCIAYDRRVYHNNGIGKYDLIKDEYKNRCPMCKEYIETERCGFNNCMYSFEGIIIRGKGEPPKSVSHSAQKVGNYYLRFGEDETEKARWASLVITTTKIKSED